MRVGVRTQRAEGGAKSHSAAQGRHPLCSSASSQVEGGNTDSNARDALATIVDCVDPLLWAVGSTHGTTTRAAGGGYYPKKESHGQEKDGRQTETHARVTRPCARFCFLFPPPVAPVRLFRTKWGLFLLCNTTTATRCHSSCCRRRCSSGRGRMLLLHRRSMILPFFCWFSLFSSPLSAHPPPQNRDYVPRSYVCVFYPICRPPQNPLHGLSFFPVMIIIVLQIPYAPFLPFLPP